MNNYIMVNGQKIELTDDQAKLILRATAEAPTIELGELDEGSTFKIGEHEFVVLEQKGDVTCAILAGLLPDNTVFSKTNNNYDDSTVDGICNDFGEEIAAIVGDENILPHSVDLEANDGLRDYGTISRKASLLTANLYRRYVDVLDQHKPNAWWWLATPHSTKRHDDDSWALCVSPSGDISSDSCFVNGNGVRPFCILKSSIFESSEA